MRVVLLVVVLDELLIARIIPDRTEVCVLFCVLEVAEAECKGALEVIDGAIRISLDQANAQPVPIELTPPGGDAGHDRQNGFQNHKNKRDQYEQSDAGGQTRFPSGN